MRSGQRKIEPEAAQSAFANLFMDLAKAGVYASALRRASLCRSALWDVLLTLSKFEASAFNAWRRKRRLLVLSSILFSPFFTAVRAEEGFWLYSEAPVEAIARKYDIHLTPEWLDHLQRSTVRFNSKRFDVFIGGSGSFVSANGLILTNRHVLPRHLLAQLDTAERNIERDGFVAKRLGEELKLPGLSLDAVVSSSDVTARVVSRVPASAVDADSNRIRRETIAEIEQSASGGLGLSAEVVALDAGARYILYVHRRYSDIRLVFAPEAAASQRPEDHPAPVFDVALVRAYESDAPAHPNEFLRVSARPPADGEPIFVGGAPTRSSRHLTVAELEARRDVEMPLWVEAYAKLHFQLAAFAAQDPEQERAVGPLLANVAFMRQIVEDRLASLRDERFFGVRRAAERHVLDALAKRGDEESIDAFKKARELAPQTAEGDFRAELLSLRDSPPWQRDGVDLPFGLEFASPLYSFGQVLVKLQQQRELPEKDRDKGYREEDRAELERWLLGAHPLDMRIEAVRLKVLLDAFAEVFGADHPLTRIALGGASSAKQAERLARGTRLNDVNFRRSLYTAGHETFEMASDPILDMLRAMEREQAPISQARRVNDALLKLENGRARRAAISVEEEASYPDASRTARFGFGSIQGWRRKATLAPYVTPIGAYFERADPDSPQPPRSAPPRWAQAASRVRKAIALDFVSTVDVVAGHSGSATVDAEGSLIGVVFGPGAIEGATTADCAYEAGKPRRAAHVSTAAIIEALDNVYDAHHLVLEMLTGSREQQPASERSQN